MIRPRRLQTSFLLLAIAATLLMMLAPVLSRALQSADTARDAMPMHQHDHAAMQMPMAPSAHAGHEYSAATDEHAAHATRAETGKSSAITDEHAAHGEACDYCTMASRLLPWLALLLVLAAVRYRWLATAVPHAPALPAIRWPAHAARGPPLPV